VLGIQIHCLPHNLPLPPLLLPPLLQQLRLLRLLRLTLVFGFFLLLQQLPSLLLQGSDTVDFKLGALLRQTLLLCKQANKQASDGENRYDSYIK
jgi:hypothetical protein